jgi:hypothetical protein
MDAETILAKAREPGDPPEYWTIIPLDQAAVRKSAFGWAFAALVGFSLFALLFFSTFAQFNVVIWIVLAVMAFVGLGSTWLLIKKVRQLLDANRHLIVMTPDTYVQQVGSRIVAVPMGSIANITLRGVFGGNADNLARDATVPTYGQMVGRMFGGSQAHRTRRTPDSLAFVDTRTDEIVVVAEDNSFAHLALIEEMLRTYVDAARRARTH